MTNHSKIEIMSPAAQVWLHKEPDQPEKGHNCPALILVWKKSQIWTQILMPKCFHGLSNCNHTLHNHPQCILARQRKRGQRSCPSKAGNCGCHDMHTQTFGRSCL